jgi:actin-related protein
MIVESSHSATYIVPIFDNEIMSQAKRIDVGGKLLTN